MKAFLIYRTGWKEDGKARLVGVLYDRDRALMELDRRNLKHDDPHFLVEREHSA